MAEQTLEQKAQQYFGEHAAFYQDSVAHKDADNLNYIKTLARLHKGDALLDIATGTGHTARTLVEGLSRVVGLDLTTGMLQEAKQATSSSSCIHWACGDVHTLPFGESCFDAVSCRRAAHHFSDLPGALSEIGRVLRPSGRFILDDRSVPEDAAADKLMNQLDRWHDPSHVQQYSLSYWNKTLCDAGFQVEHLELYTRLRPLSALTTTAPAGNGERIRAALEGLEPAMAEAMGVVKKEGEIFHTHWYVVGVASLT